jgi:general secretion pathway protein J
MSFRASGFRAGFRPATGGFTLLELLVALVVLGFLLAMLSQGVRLGLQAREAAARIDAGTEQLETTSRLLRMLIARASPAEPFAQDPPFIGTPHAASFVTYLPQGFGAAATREADVGLGVDAGRRLVLRWQPHYRRWIVAAPPPVAEALLDGVERLDLAFWQPGDGSASGSWVSAWSAPEPPRLVRMRLTFARGEGGQWPDVIAARMREPPLP